MKKYLLLIVFLLCSVEFMPSAMAQTMNICINNPIPPGFVITRIFSDNNCYSVATSNNTYEIQIPPQSGTINVCKNSPIPSGFVITRIFTNISNCYAVATSNNTYELTKVPFSENMEVCNNSQIPDSYVVTDSYPSDNCSALGGNYNTYSILNEFPEELTNEFEEDTSELISQ